MDEQRIRQIIQEEIAKLSEHPIIKDVHLHIHSDNYDSVKLLKEITGIQTAVLKARVIEKLAHVIK